MRKKIDTGKGEKVPGPSVCCSDVTVYEGIFVWQSPRERGDANGGRTRIANVKICGKCLKPVGDPKRIYKPISELTAEAWGHMLKVNPTAPFYFIIASKRLVPMGYENTKPPEVRGGLPYGDPGQD